MLRHVITAMMSCLAVVLAASVALAQDFNRRYQAAFAERVANPSDTGALSTFIGTAVQIGMYDQAISTIEQHLIDYPLDAEAHLAAARLYHHLGSRELAHRHVSLALQIGTLEPGERRAALHLLASIERALGGYTGMLALTAGIGSTSFDFVPGAPYADRTDIEPFWRASGQLRIDLETPADNAVILSGDLGLTRRFGDVQFNGLGGLYDAPFGRAGITFDIGLPVDMLPTLRGQLTGYVDHETFDSGIFRRAYGVKGRLTAVPTAGSFIYAETGYGWLGDSSPALIERHRFGFEAGGTLRLAGSHALGIAGRGYVDYGDGVGHVGHLYEAELSYGSRLAAFASGPIWMHKAGIAFGRVQTPNVALGPAFPYLGNYWRAYWNHILQINDMSRIEFYLGYQETAFENSPILDRSKFDASLSYTFALY